ncbi:hypothetical protein HYX06_06600 [Candidatus Woesearchaeota archaeon]|nr:hypothetical protein [Candidatus Woesearchaeota archaeon]
MAVMKKDVNLGLLLLIVAALVMFSGFTVYYQTTFKNVSESFEIKLKELETVERDLQAKKGLLNETSVQLQLKSQKEADLSKKFVETESEREQLETDKNKLTADLSATKSELAGTKTQLEQTKVQLSNTLTDLAKKTADLSNALSDVKKFKDQVTDRDKRIACLKSNGGTSETC